MKLRGELRTAWLVAAGGFTLQAGVTAQVVQPPTLQVEAVVTGFSEPTTMAFIGPNDMLVLERLTGRVRRAIGGVLQAGAVLDVAVSTESERGLLGIALDPDFVNNRYVYLYYTEASGFDGGAALGNRVYRYTWDGSALTSPQLVLDLPFFPGPNHDGGVIEFGPDDRLYAVIGDLQHTGKLQNFTNGNDPDDTSVIFRVDRAGRGPIDNPFYDPANEQNPLNRYYAYGVRNSFGLTFDPVSGDLWDTENGELTMDEVNHVSPGFNSGWRQIMGPDELSTGNADQLWYTAGASYSDPEFSWMNTVAPTDLAFVASRRLGCGLEHRLLVGSANCAAIQRFELDPTRQSLVFQDTALQDLVADNPSPCLGEQAEIAFGSSFGLVTDIDNGPDGFVYVVALSPGTIYRIRPQSPVQGDLDGDLVPGSCDCNDAAPGSWAPPPELRQLRVSGGLMARLGWDDRTGIDGPGTTYTVVSGSLAALRASGSFADACVLVTNRTMPSYIDTRVLAAGEARWYLVRAENDCANGSYGNATPVPDPRDLLDAASPLPCQ